MYDLGLGVATVCITLLLELMIVYDLGLGIATLFIGLCVRSAVSISVTIGTGFNIKERIFITLTWLSKATVQVSTGERGVGVGVRYIYSLIGRASYVARRGGYHL